MKFKKSILLSIFLLAVLLISAVSASENTTDNIQIDDSASKIDDLSSSIDEDVISNEDDGFEVIGEPRDVEITFPDQIKAGETFKVNVTLPYLEDEDIYGNVYYFFDDSSEDEMESFVSSGLNAFSTKINEFGKHTLNVRFVSDDTSLCNNKEVSKTYNIVDYAAEISLEEDWIYGTDNNVHVSIPSYEGSCVVEINGKEWNFDLSEDNIDVYVGNIYAATVNVKVTYSGDGNKLKAKTFTKEFKILPDIVNMPSDVPFGESKEVEVNYMDGEKITFQIMDIDEETVIDEKTVTVANSKATYAIPSSLEFGESYWLYISHDGKIVGDAYIKIIPKMDIPSKFYSEKTYTIPVQFPSDFKNMNIDVDVNYNNILKGKIDSTGKYTIELTNLEAGDGVYITITVYDDLEEYYTYEKLVSVSDVDPSSVNLSVDVPNEIVKGYELFFDRYLYDDMGGYVVVYLDGVEVKKIAADEYFSCSIETDDLDFKSHSLTLNYTGDSYYEPASVEYQFNVVPYSVTIPENPLYNAGDKITVQFPEGTTGTLIIYADGKQIKKFNVAHDYDDTEGGLACNCFFDDLDLKLGSHDIRVYYKGNKATINVTKKINLDYTIRFYNIDDDFIYGDENLINIILPEDAKGSFNVTVDGKSVPYQVVDNEIYANISQFYGKHEIAVEYSGDSKYNHPLKVSQTFNTVSRISYKYSVPYKYDGEVISLLLPKDAKGNLVVEIFDEVYAKKSFENGKAVISFKDCDIGYYEFSAYYDGDDYEIEPVTGDFQIQPKISISKNKILVNETVDVYLALPSDVQGTLKVSVFGKEYSKKLSNGYAKITLSGLNIGERMIYADFVNDDPEGLSVNSFEEIVYVDPVVKFSDNMVVFGKNIVSILNPGFTGQILYSVDGVEKTVNAGSKQTDISLSNVVAGNHSIFIALIENDEHVFSETFDFTVANAAAPKLFASSAAVYCGDYYKVKVLGVDGKPLKGAKVFFKVGNNKYITRLTNAYGYATLLMNYKPAKYNVIVKYAQQTLKPKVNVVKVLTLKNIIVKKSAKQVILMATLKKGKLPIKNKIVLFKFNGRNFKAKTNSLGVAKVVVKNIFFKKLAVGKNVIYQASYLKDVVRKVVKVRR